MKTHVSAVLRKLGVRDRVQAVIAAYAAGLVRPGAWAETIGWHRPRRCRDARDACSLWLAWSRLATRPFALAALVGAAVLLVGAAAGAAPNRPDLVVRVVTHPAPSVFRGSFLDVGYRIANVGGRAAARSRAGFALSRDSRRSADDVTLKPTQPVPHLRAGRSFSHSSSFTIPRTVARGRWYVIACADASGRVNETSERNNCRASDHPVEVQEEEP